MSPAAVGAVAAGLAALALVLARVQPAGHSLRHPDMPALDDAGWSHGLVAWEAVRALATIAALALVLSADLPPWIALGAALSPSVWIRSRAHAARLRARRALTRAVAGIEASLGSGCSLPEGLRREADACTERLARAALAEACRAFDLGEGLDVALRRVAAKVDRRSSVLLETLAIGVEERLPSARLTQLIAEAVGRQQFDERLEDEIRARARGLRQQQWLLALLVPAIALALLGSMPMLSAELDTSLGRFVLIPGAIGLELAGVLLADRIVGSALR